jgi:hypothetical protein
VRPEGATVAEHHAEYLEARAVPRDGGEIFWTARKPSEIPAAFSDYQRRRAPALIAQFPSPDGVTVGWQKRDDRPRRDRHGRIAKWVSPPADRARMVLGVAAEMLDEVRDGTGPLWSVEGITRAAALAPYGIPAVAYAGCYNWQKDGEPLRCWDCVNLDGRLVFDVPDADARTNAQVQEAQAQRVAFFESRGARVLVVDVPQMNGDEHTGLDDALARGVSPYALEREARPFVRLDIGRERLKRDELLRRGVAILRGSIGALESRKARECSALAVARYMVEVSATKYGKPLEGGIKVQPSIRQIAAGVRVGLGTVSRALEHLEGEAKFLKTLEPSRGAEPATYLLLYPLGGSEVVEHMRERGGAGKEGQESKGQQATSLYQRDSSSSVPQTRGVVKSASGPEKVPGLRNSKLVHTWARKDGRRVVVDSDYFRRYGKKREAMLRYVLEFGGADETELLEKFGSRCARLRDFRRTWITPIVEDGVWVADGGSILPAPDWPEALERVRARTDEDTDNRLQTAKYARQRRQYRDYLERVRRGEDPKADPTPELKGPEHTAEALRRNAPEWERQRVEAQRDKVGTTAAVFVADELAGARAVRWREMGERWRARGGKSEDLRRAVTVGPFRFDREADGWLYVYPREAPVQEHEPAGVAILHEAPPNPPTPVVNRRASVHGAGKGEPEGERSRRREALTTVDTHDPGGDWRDHALACQCLRCASPPPEYATPFVGSAS